MDVHFELLCAVLLLGGAILQSVIGFGMGVFTIPIFVWLGIPLQNAVALTIPGVFFQTLVNSFQNQKQIPWHQVAASLAPRFAGLAVGVWILRDYVSENKDLAGLILGTTIWLILGLQFMKTSTAAMNSWWLLPIGLVSGLAAGVLGMGGPILVFWVAGQKWNVQEQRSFLWLSFLSIVPVQAALLIQQFGHEIVDPLFTGSLLAPVTMLGALIGNRIGNSLSTQKLRNLMYGLLALIACRLMMGGLYAITNT